MGEHWEQNTIKPSSNEGYFDCTLSVYLDRTSKEAYFDRTLSVPRPHLERTPSAPGPHRHQRFGTLLLLTPGAHAQRGLL